MAKSKIEELRNNLEQKFTDAIYKFYKLKKLGDEDPKKEQASENFIISYSAYIAAFINADIDNVVELVASKYREIAEDISELDINKVNEMFNKVNEMYGNISVSIKIKVQIASNIFNERIETINAVLLEGREVAPPLYEYNDSYDMDKDDDDDDDESDGNDNVDGVKKTTVVPENYYSGQLSSHESLAVASNNDVNIPSLQSCELEVNSENSPGSDSPNSALGSQQLGARSVSAETLQEAHQKSNELPAVTPVDANISNAIPTHGLSNKFEDQKISSSFAFAATTNNYSCVYICLFLAVVLGIIIAEMVKNDQGHAIAAGVSCGVAIFGILAAGRVNAQKEKSLDEDPLAQKQIN